MKGLVLEGGGLRGCFTTGVIDVFIKNGIEFDVVTGVSAGACHACSYLAGQKGRAIAVARDYIDHPEYCSTKNLIKTGNLFGEQYVFHDIPEKLYPVDNEAFKRNKSEFYVAVTDCESGKAYYPRITDLFDDIEWIRASCSLPLMSKLVMIDEKPYLDGGIADSIPIKFSEQRGCGKNVVVLTRDRNYRKKRESMYGLMAVKYRKFPRLLEAIKQRHHTYNQTLEYICEEEKKGNLIVVAPELPLAIGRTEKDKEKLTVGYKLGVKAALMQLDDIKEFLK